MILAAAGYIQDSMAQQPDVVSAIRFDYGWLGAIVSVVLFDRCTLMDVVENICRRSKDYRRPQAECKPKM